MTLLQPSQRFTSNNRADHGLGNTQLSGYPILGNHASKGADFAHLSGVKDSDGGAVDAPVSAVLGGRLPRQMIARHTPSVAFPAGMRGVVRGGRRHTMNSLTDHSRHGVTLPEDSNRGTACSAAEWPNKTIEPFVRDRDILDIPQKRSVAHASGNGGPMATMAFVMAGTPPVSLVRLATIRDRAYSKGSHIEPHSFVGGQNPLAALVTLGGFAISTLICLKIQGVL